MGLIFRLIGSSQSLWLDEAIGAEVVRGMSHKEILIDFPKVDNHPPLYYLDLKFWTSLLGYSEIALRFSSILYGVGTIVLTYLVTRKLVTANKWFPIISSLFIATSQIHIYYSQEARMYSMSAFLAAFSFLSFLYILDIHSKKRWWILFSLSITLLLFSDYMPVFMVPVFFIIGMLRKKEKEWYIKFIATFIPLLILGILWFPLFIIQSGKGKWLLQTVPGWKNIAGGATIKQLVLLWTKFVGGRISFLPKGLYYLFLGTASIPILYSICTAVLRIKKQIVLILIWLIVPVVLGFGVSTWFPAFIYFRFLYVLPAFYILISWGIVNIRSKSVRGLIFGLILFTNIGSYLIYTFDKSQQRENWKAAVKTLMDDIEDLLPSEYSILFHYPEPFSPYRWYESQLTTKSAAISFGATDSIYATEERTKDTVKLYVNGKEFVFLFDYLRELSDPTNSVGNTLNGLGFKIDRTYNFSGVGFVYRYKRS